MESPIQLQEFIATTRYCYVALYVLAVYDSLLCLTDETKYIYPSRWSGAKVVYFVCRYYPLAVFPFVLWTYIGDHDLETCLQIYKLPPLILMPNQLSAQVILLLRTYAVSRRQIWVLLTLATCLLGIAGYQLWVVSSQITLLPFPGSERSGCFHIDRTPAKSIAGFFLSSFAFDTVTLIIFATYAIRYNAVLAKSSKLTRVFVREGFGYYILISAINLTNTIYYFLPNSMGSIPSPLSFLFANVIACRLLLSLRSTAVQLVSTTFLLSNMSTLPSTTLSFRSTTLSNSHISY